MYAHLIRIINSTVAGEGAGAHLIDVECSAILGNNAGWDLFMVKNAIVTNNVLLCSKCLHYLGLPFAPYDQDCPLCKSRVILK